MRTLILDTETSGLDPENDRIIELACLELIDNVATENKFHRYYNPGNILISNQAEEIHGLNNSFLSKFPTFDDSINEFLEFVAGSPFIIHNAQFDISMINASLNRLGKKPYNIDEAKCTLEMAKKKFPGSKNNLNALCRRFNISLESREKHGALTDCFLLLRVYTELIGGKQESLNLLSETVSSEKKFSLPNTIKPIIVDISQEEEKLHENTVESIPNSIWKLQ